MSWNPYATQTQNGVVHQAPSGFEDTDYAYVINMPPNIFNTFAQLQFTNNFVGGPSTEQFTAKSAGSGGNLISITTVQGGGALSIAVNGNAITITVAAAGSTFQAVHTALSGNGAVTALVSLVLSGPTLATWPVKPQVFLTGGGTSSTSVLSPSGSVGDHFTFLYVTEADAIFICTGLEIPLAKVGFRIRWNNEYLSDDYLYSGQTWNSGTAQIQGSSPVSGNPVAPFPVWPNKILPPQSLLNIDLVNTDSVAQYYYPLTLRGYKRRIRTL